MYSARGLVKAVQEVDVYPQVAALRQDYSRSADKGQQAFRPLADSITEAAEGFLGEPCPVLPLPGPAETYTNRTQGKRVEGPWRGARDP